MSDRDPFIHPDWPAPPNVKALATTRQGGCSQGPYASLNLAMHVEDDPDCVRRNRELLRAMAQLPSEPIWLQQVHGTAVWSGGAMSPPPTADAAVTRTPGEVCAIMTADCLPVLLCDASGTVVGAAHAGWRGLVGGVLETTIAAMNVPAGELIAWLGPAIEPDAFEVGPEVLDQFVARHSEAAAAFTPNARGRWQADLYALARIELGALGVSRIYGGGCATVADTERFFSYRRDRRTGRMATLIWLA
jgi:YfiH family protein